MKKPRPKLQHDFLDQAARQVRVHWFVRDPAGGVTLSPNRKARKVDHTQAAEPKVSLVGGGFLGGVTGYIACQPQRKEIRARRLSNGMTVMFHYSDSRKAVNCPLCIASAVYQAAQKKEEEKNDEQNKVLAEAGLRKQENRRNKNTTKREA